MSNKTIVMREKNKKYKFNVRFNVDIFWAQTLECIFWYTRKDID